MTNWPPVKANMAGANGRANHLPLIQEAKTERRDWGPTTHSRTTPTDKDLPLGPKVSPTPKSHTLRTKPSTHGPLDNIQHPNYSTHHQGHEIHSCISCNHHSCCSVVLHFQF
jgi:hypothetical protein